MTTEALPPVTQLKPLPTEPRPGLLRALGAISRALSTGNRTIRDRSGSSP